MDAASQRADAVSPGKIVYRILDWKLNCSTSCVENRTEPKTFGQWIRYVVVAIIALFLVVWLLRLYIL